MARSPATTLASYGNLPISELMQQIEGVISEAVDEAVARAKAETFQPGDCKIIFTDEVEDGCLLCDGSERSRTEYAALFARIGTTFGAGDGSTTFNLPEGRGEFLRGADNGRGVDEGRVIGSHQMDQMQRITGELYIRRAQHGSSSGAFSSESRSGGESASSGSYGVDIYFDSANSPGARAGDETRPRNIAVNFLIKT